MKKAWLLAAVGLLTIVFALGAVACGDDDDDDPVDGDLPTLEATEPADEPTEPADTSPADGTPEAGAAIAPITMEAVGDAGASGSASIAQSAAGGTEVEVTIDSGLEAGTHVSHIHHGTCATEPGEIHVDLTSIEADASGAGTAATTDPVPPDGSVAPAYDHYLAREHYVAVHALDGTLVSCGDVVPAD